MQRHAATVCLKGSRQGRLNCPARICHFGAPRAWEDHRGMSSLAQPEHTSDTKRPAARFVWCPLCSGKGSALEPVMQPAPRSAVGYANASGSHHS